jgi:death on curing protein
MIDYLTAAELIAIHADQIECYGGTHGIRDRGALEAALFRPQTGYYQDIIEEAAALWESLAMNHPFIDGNKRPEHFSIKWKPVNRKKCDKTKR